MTDNRLDARDATDDPSIEARDGAGDRTPDPGHLRPWVRVVIAVGLLTTAGAFAMKIFSFLFTLESEDAGSFAAVPVATYFAVAAGYLLLFVWAYTRGHFRDLEAPKHRMLEMEARHDRDERATV